MRNILLSLIMGLLCLLLPMREGQAAGLHDYKGTLGDQKIGLTITTDDGFDYAMGHSKITALHYFYVKYLRVRPETLSGIA